VAERADSPNHFTDGTTPQLEAPSVLVSPAPSGRAALRVLQIGAVVIVIAAVTWKEFELDRFYVPKELVLHLTAFLGGLFAVRSVRRQPLTRIDLLLIAFVGAGALSALFAANGWLAVRALTMSASAVVIFWTARALRRAGLAGPLLGAIAVAVVVGVGTSLLQTYGVTTDMFSLNRAPGGTLGNRNSIAHMAAFGLPIVLLVALRATHWAHWLSAGIGATLVAATLVLTRSRAGFLALGAVLFVLVAALIVSPALRRHGRTWLRLTVIAMLAGAGIAAAALAPNALNWRSDNPYMETLTGVANYQEGSGRGRLVQYRQSLRMAVDNPLLGVGPGNWAVEYPDYAAARDPSLDNSAAGMTSNPWPSSDWVAFVSERGFIASLLLCLALLGIAIRAIRQLVREDADEALGATALLATLAAACIAGLFDAVLLLALPSLLVFAVLGALWPIAEHPQPPRPSAGAAAALLVLSFMAAIGALRSAAQVTAMGIYASSSSTAWLSRAAFVDPGGYRLHTRLAQRGSGLNREERCVHARAARDLYPNAREARNLADGCD
jgi:O-antigen ligase